MARIRRLVLLVNAFVSLAPERRAGHGRGESSHGSSQGGKKPAPLIGLPNGVKDLEDVGGMVASFGSVPFKDNVAAEDSIQVARLRKAGAIVTGKTNTPEFGSTGLCKNRLPGMTRNPWNIERTAGDPSIFPPPTPAASVSNPLTGEFRWEDRSRFST